jgi:hypothetical protein
VSGEERRVSGKRLRHSHIFDRASNNYYREPAWVSRRLFERETFPGVICDGCCGSGTIPEAARAAGLPTFASDLVDRGYGIVPLDFLTEPVPITLPFSFVSNPPHEGESERQFVERAFELGAAKVAVLLQTTKLHAAWRWVIPLRLTRVYLLTPRPSIPPGEMIERGEKAKGGIRDYSWAVFDRAHRKGSLPVFSWLHRDEGAKP